MKRKKRFIEMNTRELAAATREFDKENLNPRSLPMPPELKARIDRVLKRGRGRPKVGKGAQRVLITVERGLLKEADGYARRTGMTRSEMIARGLRLVMRRGGAAA